MRDITLNFPKQFARGIQAAQGVSLTRTYARIICCGMGGSAIPGELLSMVRDNVCVHWDYALPALTGPDDLVICTSWSGGTEETISSFTEAQKRKLDTVVITKDNSPLAKAAKTAGAPLVLMPDENIPPRTAAGYMAGALFKVLGAERELELTLDAAASEKEGKELADKIGSKVPLLYTSYPLRKLAGFWKVFFNENAKLHAFTNWVPSMVHNEIVGFVNKNREMFVPVILRDPSESGDHKRNLDALLAIFDKMSYNYLTVKLSAEGKLLQRIFENYILGLWTSYYLAKNLGVNPEDTGLIEEFKKLKKG